jgi:FkbM family methyltransferase
MKKAFFTIIHQVLTICKIGRLKIEKDLKIKIIKTYLFAIVFKRINSKNKTLNFIKYKFNFLNYDIFKYLFQEIFVNQEYYFITKNRSPMIIDCGSNIGMSVLYFKLMYPHSTIIAFEPDEDAFLCLKSNVEQNNLQSIEINNKAVSENEGKKEFYYDTESPGSLAMSTIRARITKQKREVDAVRLSKYVNEEVDFLKMDIEGAELGVIQELNNSGKLNYVKQMAIEYHHHNVKDQDMLSIILSILEKAGFGYQIASNLGRPFIRHEFQYILIYAYQNKFSTEPINSEPRSK